MLPDLLSDLAAFYHNNKDAAVAAAGAAWPACRVLYAASHWLMAKRPEEPLEEAVALLIDGIGKAELGSYSLAGTGLFRTKTPTVRFGDTHVCGGRVWVGNNLMDEVTGYSAAARKAIAAAYRERLPVLMRQEEERKARKQADLRERAALGN
jgi:hypothetical protein